jgi:hypothetical protein
VRVWLAVLVGIVAVIVASAAIGSRDDSGEAVRPSSWADHTCRTIGAWEGDLEAIGDELRSSNTAARQNDGGSGDHVERTIYVRDAVDRAIQVTNETLQEGLKRAGYPDVAQGRQAALILQNWAQQTENALIAVSETLEDEPATPSTALGGLADAASALRASAVGGRAAFAQVAALDPELADALDGSDDCDELQDEQP